MKIGGPFHDKSRSHAKKSWYLSYFIPRLDDEGRAVLVDGKMSMRRERPYYPSKQSAIEDKPRILAQYATGGTVAGRLLSREEVEDHVQATTIAPGVRMVDLANFWRKHHPLGEAKMVATWAADFLADTELRLGKGRHYEDLKSRLDQFCRTQGDRDPNLVTRDEILSYLKGLERSGRTVMNHKRALCNFFGWLFADKAAIASNPAGGIKKRQLPKFTVKEIGFLSVGEADRYLDACERYDPDLVAHEVIQLFAGVRADDEMADFRGEWVLPATKEVVIPAEIAKTEKREVISGLEDNFWEWWAMYGRLGVLRPKNIEPRWLRVRALATMEDRDAANAAARLPIKFLLADPKIKARLAKWPWNARRRTFCTYHVAKYQSAAGAALILRHRGEITTLHNSYRGVGVTQAQGVAFFARQPMKHENPIRPERVAKGIIRLQAN